MYTPILCSNDIYSDRLVSSVIGRADSEWTLNDITFMSNKI